MAFKRIVTMNITPPELPTLKISGLKIEFDILKNTGSAPNVCKISIYNMKESIAKQYGKGTVSNIKGNTIILFVGYEDEGTGVLFIGEILRSLYKRDGLDTIWEVEAQDGVSALTTAKVSFSFGESTSVSTVIEACINAISLSIGNSIPSLSQSYAHGYVYQGLASKALSEVLAFVGLRWTVQNNQLFILGQGEILTDTTIVLSKETGLLYAPEALDDKGQFIGMKESIPTKLKLKALINPIAVPGMKIKLQSTIASGVFKIESAHFTGDNWTGDFQMDLEVRAV